MKDKSVGNYLEICVFQREGRRYNWEELLRPEPV